MKSESWSMLVDQVAKRILVTVGYRRLPVPVRARGLDFRTRESPARPGGAVGDFGRGGIGGRIHVV